MGDKNVQFMLPRQKEEKEKANNRSTEFGPLSQSAAERVMMMSEGGVSTRSRVE